MKTSSRDLPDRMLRVTWRQKSGPRSAYYYNNQTGYLPSRPKTKIPLGTDRAVALRKYAEMEGAEIPLDQQTVGYAWNLYTTHKKGLVRLKPRTQYDYRRYWDALEPAVKHTAWRSITVPDLNGYIEKRSARVRANREIALLSILWNFALARSLTTAPNVCQHVERNEEQGRDRYVTDAEFAAVYEAADQLVRDAMDLAYLTGQRPSDTLALRWEAVQNGYLQVQQTKRGAKVAIAVEGELATLLARLRARPVMSPYLLTDARGWHPSLRKFRDRFNSAVTAAGVKDFWFVDLRPKSASDTQEGASDRLGHTSETITKRIYRRVPTKARPTR